MAVEAGGHRVRALPRHAGDRAGGVRAARLHRGAGRLLLPRHVAAMGLPARHVSVDFAALLLHDLRLRRHE